MNCLAYLRRSKKSDGKTVSLEAQEESVRKYALAVNLHINCIIRDDGISGGDNDRFKRIYSMLLHNDARAVLCYHVDRFSRDMAGFFAELQRYSKEDIQLWVVDRGQIKTEKSSDFLMTSIEGVIAQHTRMLTGEKTKDALALLKREGRRFTRHAPYGSFHMDGRLHRHVEEQKIMGYITERRCWSSGRLKKWLEERLIFTREGKPWSRMTLYNLQRRTDDQRPV